MCVCSFLIPQCEITSRPTGRNRLRVQWSKPVSLLFLWSAPLATVRAASGTTTASPLRRLTPAPSCIKAGICERNENWHQPDYNYPCTLSISMQHTPLSARGFLFLDAILLWVSVGFWAHLEWQLAIHLVDKRTAELTAWSRSPFGRPTEFWLTWFDCSQIACQEISLILISSVTKVDQAVLSKTQIMAELQCSCRCSSGKWEQWHAILTHRYRSRGYYASTALLIYQKSSRSYFDS